MLLEKKKQLLFQWEKEWNELNKEDKQKFFNKKQEEFENDLAF